MRKSIIAILFVTAAIASCTKKSLPNASPDGAQIFAHNCQRCHGEHGIKDSRTPNLPELTYTKEHLVNSITNGKDHMPAFKDKLSAAQISAVADLLISWRKK